MKKGKNRNIKQKSRRNLYVIVVILIILIIVLSIFYVRFSGYIVFGSRYKTIQCFDSDNGLNYTLKGYVTNYHETRKIFYDICLKDNQEVLMPERQNILWEGYCENNTGNYKEYLCPRGSICFNGACSQGACDNKCNFGERKCSANFNNTLVCDDWNKDGCLEWQNSNPNNICSTGCDPGTGKCKITECTSKCFVLGQRKCSLNNNSLACKDWNGDGCLEWEYQSLNNVCALGCNNLTGNCKSNTCKEDCRYVGQKRCFDNNKYKQICGYFDNDVCLDWKAPVYCTNKCNERTGECN